MLRFSFIPASLSFRWNICNVVAMRLLPDCHVVVLGSVSHKQKLSHNTWILAQYDIHSGNILKSSVLKKGIVPTGMAVVTVAGQQRVAVSCR